MPSLAYYLPVEAKPPRLQDNTGDIDRLRNCLTDRLAGIAPVVPFDRIRQVAEGFRGSGFKGAAVINDMPNRPELVDFLPAPPPVLPGLALDLGTTHLEAGLVDLMTGKTLAEANEVNSQIEFGADILSRIHFAGRGSGLDSLHNAIIDSVNMVATRLADQAGLAPQEIRALTVSGNTTMIHLFLGLDPYHLCREPYIPLVNAPDPCRAKELSLVLHPAAPVWCLPSVGSYFGGDLIAGILATGLANSPDTCMLIDVGTNAEVVIGNKEWLIACAGAAGPALEGGVAKMGMRAGPGAIEHVRIDSDTGKLDITTIGNVRPRGLCGSGIIDLAAELYLARIIDIRGKFKPETGQGRLIKKSDGYAYVIANGDMTADNEPVVFGQIDLDAVMRSKAAMFSILTTLVNQVGLSFEDLHQIFVAGAFGRHIDPRQAIVLGMLPDLPLQTYVPVGNTSLSGAREVLLKRDARQESMEIVNRTTYIELNVNQEFMNRFSGSKFIPHTDHTLFPSVPFFNDA